MDFVCSAYSAGTLPSSSSLSPPLTSFFTRDHSPLTPAQKARSPTFLLPRKRASLSIQAIATPQNLPSSDQSQSKLPPSFPPAYQPASQTPYNPDRPSAGVQGHMSSFDPSHLLGAPRSGTQVREPSGLLSSPRKSEAGVDEVWLRIRTEARHGAEAEPFLASYMYSAILAHPSMEGALAFHLANKLSNPTLLSTQLKELFTHVLSGDARIQEAIRADLVALEARDPACLGYAHGMLNFKGYLAIQTYRIAHRLWTQGREGLALALANRVSEMFHVEIHPAARIGKGLLLDHATGVVIGETAFIGDNVSILHDVTLGGTGCLGCLRHPQVEEGVLIGAGAKLLGPITVGRGSRIGAGSVVLQDVPPNATVVGNPGRVVAEKKGVKKETDMAPSETMNHADFADWVI